MMCLYAYNLHNQAHDSTNHHPLHEDFDVQSKKQIFNKYELGELLGYGSYGKVYSARDLRTGEAVAIKVMNKRTVAKREDNVVREIANMRRLRHRHIVKIFEVLATRSKIYCVMELVKGGDLASKFVNCGRFSEDHSRRWFQQLITAVKYCHSRGVFHRDIKPENLLLDENLNLKLSDFGCSAYLDRIQSDKRLQTLCGTLAYVAPEMLGRKEYDGAKADVWSCGVVLYVLTTGALPFDNCNVTAIYNRMCRGEFSCPKWMPSDLKRILQRLMDPNPSTRISIDEIMEDPWFNKGYGEIESDERDYFDCYSKLKKSDRSERYLNAFDLISSSPSLDLSKLFTNLGELSDSDETLVTAK